MKIALVIAALVPLFSFATPEKPRAYLKFGLGASFSTKGNIQAPLSFWDRAVQGYDDNFGVAPVFETAFGYDCVSFFTVQIGLSYRAHYRYEKFQTPPDAADRSTGFLGQKTRLFAFDVTSLLASCFFNGRGIQALHWQVGPSTSALFPFVGGGAGISEICLYDFRSVDLPPTGRVDDVPSFASENAYTKRYRFTYNIAAGLEYRFLTAWALSLGYRWFATGRFRGPSFIRDRFGNAGDARGLEWKQRLSAHEVFLHLKYYL